MSSTNSRKPFPLSTPNLVVLGLSFFGTVFCQILGNIPGALLLGVLLIGILISAILGRRPGASDWMRVNAIEYRDERDARLAMRGFAVVGAWALALAMLELVAATVFVGAIGFHGVVTHRVGHGFTVTSTPLLGIGLALELIAALQLLVLAIVWGVANTRAVRRG